MANIDKIKALAKEKGIKIKYICSQLGLSETYLSNVKNGKDRMTDERLAIIAQILGTTTEYLTDKTDKKNIAPDNDIKDNTIFVAGRNGSFTQRRLTDEQVDLFLKMINQLPDADDL